MSQDLFLQRDTPNNLSQVLDHPSHNVARSKAKVDEVLLPCFVPGWDCHLLLGWRRMSLRVVRQNKTPHWQFCAEVCEECLLCFCFVVLLDRMTGQNGDRYFSYLADKRRESESLNSKPENPTAKTEPFSLRRPTFRRLTHFAPSGRNFPGQGFFQMTGV